MVPAGWLYSLPCIIDPAVHAQSLILWGEIVPGEAKNMTEYLSVQWALDSQHIALGNMRVHHGGAHIIVSKQFLDSANVVPFLY